MPNSATLRYREIRPTHHLGDVAEFWVPAERRALLQKRDILNQITLIKQPIDRLPLWQFGK
jgi:hypothetical protein